MTDTTTDTTRDTAAGPTPPPDGARSERTQPALWKRLAPWAITAVCFGYLYLQIESAAARQGSSLVPYLAGVFSNVDWISWLGLMIPYSMFFFLVDSLIVWRVINWFNARVSYGDILPVRASTYVLSILNEQIGKGAMALYLNRREGVPGWQVGSSMLFIMFCEFYYLATWATIGALLRWDEVDPVFHSLPWVWIVGLALFVLHILYFNGTLFPGSKIRERHILQAFRDGRPWQYLVIVLMRSPALLAAVFVYQQALALFGVEVGSLEMLGILPLIFFGAAVPGPFRAVAISMWVTLFPAQAGALAAFGLVQHNFFIFFNAAIGLLFMRRAQREIFGGQI